MNGSHFSIFMMSVTLAYSAPQRKCITRRQGSYTDNSGRVVINYNKNVNGNNNANNNNNVNKNNANGNNIGPIWLPKMTATTPRPRKRCCPYHFDSEQCQIVNDRKVCGYNMNSGGPDENPAEQAMDMGNGCWFRRGRLECGYQEGPFEGIRRPPVYDRTTTPDQDDGDDVTEQTNDYQEHKIKERLVNHHHSPVRPKTTITLPSCVQIRRKIVCSTITL